MTLKAHIQDFTVSTHKAKLQIDVIHQFLKNSYWAENIPLEIVEKSIENSLCFGVYLHNEQVGFARVVSDFATFGYLADVFIVEKYRGLGLSKLLLENIIHHPDLQGFRRWLLGTTDAQGLYEKFGFKALAKPERMMEIARPDMYKIM